MRYLDYISSPSIPLSALAMLLHFNGTVGNQTYTDSSPHNAGPATIFLYPKLESGAKFGSACAGFRVRGGGSQGYLEKSYASWLDFSSGDFTVQFWFKSTASTMTTARIVSFCKPGPAVAADYQYSIAVNSIGQLYASVYSGAIGYTVGTTAWAAYADGNWHFAELCRIGNNFYFRINGSLIGTIIQAITLNTAGTWMLEIGAVQPSISQPYWGYLDDFRLIQGYGLNYLTNPTAEFSNTSINLVGG